MVSCPGAYSSTITALGGGLSRENPSKVPDGVAFEALKFWMLAPSLELLTATGWEVSGETGRARGTLENTGLLGVWVDRPPIAPKGGEGVCAEDGSS